MLEQRLPWRQSLPKIEFKGTYRLRRKTGKSYGSGHTDSVGDALFLFFLVWPAESGGYFPTRSNSIINDYARHFQPDGLCTNGKQRQIRDYNLGQNKQQTPTPPYPTPLENQGWSRAKGKNAPFSHFWFGGRGGFLGFPFVCSRL